MKNPADQTRATVEWAVVAESLGYDVLFVADRLLATAHSGKGLAVYEATMIDPFVMLAAISARTERIRLAPLVAVVPFRHPASMAKLTASLDVRSGRGFICRAGSGRSAPELRMFGVDRRRRGDQLEEGIDLLRQLWRGEPVTHHGEFWSLDDVRVLPRPVQDPGPPIWLGSFAPDDAVTWNGHMTGAQTRALRRIGRIADGWVPLTYSAGHKRQLDSAQLAKGWEIIVEAAEAAGRKPTEIEIVYAHWIAIVRWQVKQGVGVRAGLLQRQTAYLFPCLYHVSSGMRGTLESTPAVVRPHAGPRDRLTMPRGRSAVQRHHPRLPGLEAYIPVWTSSSSGCSSVIVESAGHFQRLESRPGP